MTAHPGQLLTLVLLGFAALSLLAEALYLLRAAFRPRRRLVPVDRRQTAAPAVAAPSDRGHRALLLAIALALLTWVFAGRFVVALLHPAGGDAPEPDPGTTSRLRGASGADLAVTHYGPADGPVLVFTHGWGADRRDWAYAIGALPQRFHVVAWDLPGLGESSPMPDGDYSMRTMASDLDSVVSSLKGRPVILVGHSIGGMLNIEYARRFPDKLGREVKALVQANTTYTNPVETKKGAELSRMLQKPVYEPLLELVTLASPVVRGLGWLAYQSGLAHLQLASQSFAGAETREQLDQMARYAYRSSPGVIAQGVLGMLHWDGSAVLPTIDVPTLIISGDEDVTTLPAASDRMQRDIKASTRVRVSPAAHLGPVERYKTYADAIAAFTIMTSGGRAAPSR